MIWLHFTHGWSLALDWPCTVYQVIKKKKKKSLAIAFYKSARTVSTNLLEFYSSMQHTTDGPSSEMNSAAF